MNQRPHATDGLLVVKNLTAQGLTEAELRGLRREHHRVRRGVYVDQWSGRASGDHLIRAKAVLAEHSPGTALTHVSAAVGHGLPLWRADLDDVHVLGATRAKRRRGIKYHWYPEPPQLQVADGLLVTSAAQTVWDAARTWPFESAVVLGDGALQAGMSRHDLATVAERYPRQHGRRRAAMVIAALDDGAESPGETRSRLVVIRLGYPVRSQFVITLPDGTLFRADLWIDGTQVLVDFDGKAKYAADPLDTIWREKRRADRLADEGWQIVRLTWADLDRPAEVDRRIRQALARTR